MYANVKIRDRVVELAEKYNVFPNDLEKEGIVKFTKEDGVIIGVQEVNDD